MSCTNYEKYHQKTTLEIKRKNILIEKKMKIVQQQKYKKANN